MATVQERKEQRLECTWEATKAGIISASVALAASWPAVYFANQRFAGFRTRLGVSGKTALVVRGWHLFRDRLKLVDVMYLGGIDATVKMIMSQGVYA